MVESTFYVLGGAEGVFVYTATFSLWFNNIKMYAFFDTPIFADASLIFLSRSAGKRNVIWFLSTFKMIHLLMNRLYNIMGNYVNDMGCVFLSLFSERIKWLRERKKLSQKEVAELVGMSQQGYSNIENGNREPNLTVLAKLPGILGESLDFMIGITDMDTSTNHIRLRWLETLSMLNNYKLEIANAITKNGDEEYMKLKIHHLNDLITEAEKQAHFLQKELDAALSEIPRAEKNE